MKTKDWIGLVMITIVVCLTVSFMCIQMRGCEEQSQVNNHIKVQWYKDNGYIKKHSNWSGYYWVLPDSEGEE